MIYPSKFGTAVVGLIFFLYLASIQTQSGVLFLILGVLTGCIALNSIKAFAIRNSLRLQPPGKIITGEGQRMQDAWLVENIASAPAGHVEINSPWGRILRIGAIRPGDCLHVTPEVRFARRGVYPFPDLRLICSFPFGLIRYCGRLKCAGEFVIYPSVYSCPPPPASGFEPMLGGRFIGKHKARTGDHFQGVREFAPQDPVKMIHWPSSSKGQGLMVKEFEEEVSGRVSFILECGAGEEHDGETALDWATRAAGSLVLSALDSGYHVEFAHPETAEILSVTPFDDGDVVLEMLARVSPRTAAAQRQRLPQLFGKLSRKSGVCFVVTSGAVEFLEFIRSLPADPSRKISVYAPHYTRDRHWDIGAATIRYYGKNGISE